MHDDAVERAEQPLPQVALVGRPARQQVVRGEDRRAIGSGCGRRPAAARATAGAARRPARVASERDDAEVLDRLQRQPRPRAPEEARRQRIEALGAPVPVGRRQLCEAEMRRRELDLGAGAGERARRARGRTTACRQADLRSRRARSPTVERRARPDLEPLSRQHRSRPAGRPTSARWSSSSPPTSPTSSASRRSRPGRSTDRRVGRDAGRHRPDEAPEARPDPDPGVARARADLAASRQAPLGFAGQGNAILIPTEATIRTDKTITLNTNPFCEEQAARARARRRSRCVWWEKERRVCHIVQYELPNRQRILVANLHATSSPRPAPRRTPSCDGRRTSSISRLRARGGADRRRRLQHHPRAVDDDPGADDGPARVALDGRPARRSTTSCCGARSQRSVRVWPDEERDLRRQAALRPRPGRGRSPSCG